MVCVFGQPCSAPQQQLWSGAHANGGLKREKANRPITTNCEKNRSLRCSTRMRLKGVVFLLKRKRAIPFPPDFTSFCWLAEPAIYITSDHQGRTPQPRSHGPHQFIQPEFAHKKKQRILHGQRAFNINYSTVVFSFEFAGFFITSLFSTHYGQRIKIHQ